MGWRRSIFCAQRLSYFWAAILGIRKDRRHQLKTFLDQARFQDLPSFLCSNWADRRGGPGENSSVAASTDLGSHFSAKLFFAILATHLVAGGRGAFLFLAAAAFHAANADWQRQDQSVSRDPDHFLKPLSAVPLLANSRSPSRRRLGPHRFSYAPSRVTLGYYAHFTPESFREAGKPWVLGFGLFFAATFVIMPDVPRLTFAYVAFSFIVAWAVNRPSSRNPLAKGLSWIGYYSYSIYLWHVVAMLGIEQLPAGWFRVPLYFSSAIGLGVLMSKLIEVPALKLRDRVFPSGAAAREQAARARISKAQLVTTEVGV
jgi:peptidoglycan/LPS O-acetylase OafA/YrhL